MSDRIRPRVIKQFTKPSRTKQAFRDECDVNLIMKRFKRDCGVDFLNRFQGYVDGNFGDFSNVTDYRTALDQLVQAEEMFMMLPSSVRSEFHNDPANFLDFVADPKNEKRLVDLGLATPKPGINPSDLSKMVDVDLPLNS